MVVGSVPVNQVGILTAAWLRLRVVYCTSFYFVCGSLCVAGYLATGVEHRWRRVLFGVHSVSAPELLANRDGAEFEEGEQGRGYLTKTTRRLRASCYNACPPLAEWQSQGAGPIGAGLPLGGHVVSNGARCAREGEYAVG